MLVLLANVGDIDDDDEDDDNELPLLLLLLIPWKNGKPFDVLPVLLRFVDLLFVEPFNVDGVGVVKLSLFGWILLDAIRKYCL